MSKQATTKRDDVQQPSGGPTMSWVVVYVGLIAAFVADGVANSREDVEESPTGAVEITRAGEFVGNAMTERTFFAPRLQQPPRDDI